MIDPEVVIIYALLTEAIVALCLSFIIAMLYRDDSKRIAMIYYATDDEIKHAGNLIRSEDNSVTRLRIRIEKEIGIPVTDDMLKMAICAQKGKVIDQARYMGSRYKHLKIHTRFAIWLYRELRNNGFPYPMRCRPIGNRRKAKASNSSRGVNITDIPIWDITPFREGESCFSFNNYHEISWRHYTKNIYDTIIRLRRDYKINPWDYLDPTEEKVAASNSRYIKENETLLLQRAVREREKYRKFFIKTYGATEQDIKEARLAILKDTEEVKSIRNRIRSEAMVDPTDDRVLRVFLAKKISLLPDDIMRGILVRDNQEEPNFVVWYNDELRANGFPFSMHYTEKNNQKRYLRKITDTPEISYRLSYMI